MHREFFAVHIYQDEFHITIPQESFHEARASFHVRSTFHLTGVFMSDNLVLDLSMQFAIDIVNLCESLKGRNSLTNQLLRSGTSIGANIHEGNYASSKADFVAKFQIALKECYETEYWLELFVKSGILSTESAAVLYTQCGTIRRILIASINTAKENKK